MEVSVERQHIKICRTMDHLVGGGKVAYGAVAFYLYSMAYFKNQLSMSTRRQPIIILQGVRDRHATWS